MKSYDIQMKTGTFPPEKVEFLHKTKSPILKKGSDFPF